MKFSNLNISSLSAKIYKNILLTLPIKGINALITLALIPLMYDFLKPEAYGIWILIFTIFNWIGLFDLGLANGLKNRLVSALAKTDYQLAKEYVSTAYVAIGLISFSIFTLMIAPILLLDWSEWFNIPSSLNIKSINLLVCGLFAVRFTLQVLGSVLIAQHKIYKADLINLISAALVLVLMFTIVKTETFHGSLFTVILINMLTPIAVFAIASIYLYSGELRKIAPSVSLFKYYHLKSLLHLGLNFLWIRINGIILLQSAYLIISSQLSPSDVTTYSIVFNYFNSIQVILNVFVNPYWPAVTEAITKNDMDWIRINLKRVRLVTMAFFIVSISLYFLSDYLIPLWIGKTIDLERNFVLLMCIYTMMNMWKGIYSFFLNGMEIVKVQSMVASGTAICFLILSFPLIGLFGLTGVVLASVISGIPRVVIYPLALAKRIR